MQSKEGRTRNWKQYSENLVKRGEITLWIDVSVFDEPQAASSATGTYPRRGRGLGRASQTVTALAEGNSTGNRFGNTPKLGALARLLWACIALPISPTVNTTAAMPSIKNAKLSPAEKALAMVK